MLDLDFEFFNQSMSYSDYMEVMEFAAARIVDSQPSIHPAMKQTLFDSMPINLDTFPYATRFFICTCRHLPDRVVLGVQMDYSDTDSYYTFDEFSNWPAIQRLQERFGDAFSLTDFRTVIVDQAP